MFVKNVRSDSNRRRPHHSGTSQKVAKASKSVICSRDKSAQWTGSRVCDNGCLCNNSIRKHFPPQADRSRVGENPLHPAWSWSARPAFSLEQNVSFSHTGAGEHQFSTAVAQKVGLRMKVTAFCGSSSETSLALAAAPGYVVTAGYFTLAEEAGTLT